jgi:hypothetical protein
VLPAIIVSAADRAPLAAVSMTTVMSDRIGLALDAGSTLIAICIEANSTDDQPSFGERL